MKLMPLLSGKGFVMYNKQLAHTVSVNGAIIFGQLCSSYESFGSKGMLTARNDKEYFFLTSETLKEETALTYKQQMKAVKELEDAGFIETKIMGVPSKKYFHITDKIAQELVKPSSYKREDLKDKQGTVGKPSETSSRNDKRSILPLTKDTGKHVQKGSAIKNKNKKEQYKDNKNNIDNYQGKITKSLEPNQFKSLMTDAVNEFYTKFALGRWSKKQWGTLVDQFVTETIESGRYANILEDKIKGYAYKSLQRMCDHSDYKRSEEFAEYQELMMEFVRRRENDDYDELPY
ncbi:hypothetical protein [Cytobacillus sp. FSL H8-0458]|uniref:hypothetical protein n=1 Tax=Cytobacillus sp. FSL H8-0458 TaxID=2975346 RepID=UPI0030F75158